MLFHDDAETPLGLVALAATIKDHTGMPPGLSRVYGSFAMTWVVRGEGTYRDANHAPRRLRGGDVVLVFPELAHNYRPLPGTVWDEAYFVFAGPAFEALREMHLFSPSRPVIRPRNLLGSLGAMQATLVAACPPTAAGRALRVARFAAALTELLVECADLDGQDPRSDRQAAIDRARQLLGSGLGEPLRAREVAARVGLGYEAFRKGFTQSVGAPPCATGWSAGSRPRPTSCAARP